MYIRQACLVHFSSKLTCGVANFGIAHWVSFLERTADRRRNHRRQEYGDERDAEVRACLERISPLNNAEKIAVPLSIAHGEEDSRVPVGEALRMWDIASKRVYMELMVCELEGHGTWWRAHTTQYPERESDHPRSTRKTDARHSFFPPCYLGFRFQAEERDRIHERRQDPFLGEIFAARRETVWQPLRKECRGLSLCSVARPFLLFYLYFALGYGYEITRLQTSKSKTHGNIYFRSQNFPWGGQQRRVLAIQGKTPGSKPPTFFLVWAFFCLLRRRGVRVPVPQQLVRTPRASGRVAASPRHYLRTFTPSATTILVTKVLKL
jgi:hypothetical protein